MESSGVTRLPSTPSNPLDLFLLFLNALSSSRISMNLATVDRDEGVMARTVAFDGLENNAFRFITERSSTKFQNIRDNPQVALTFRMDVQIDGATVRRQVRVNGRARELQPSTISNYWSRESLSAKIRSRICDCQTPQSWSTVKRNHDSLLRDYEKRRDPLNQTPTFTVLEVIPRRIEFFQSLTNEISDRVIYRKYSKDNEDKWKMERICC